jgi:hypothetical protein
MNKQVIGTCSTGRTDKGELANFRNAIYTCKTRHPTT